MRAKMVVGPLRVQVEQGYKARALDAGEGQALLQFVPDGAPWPSSRCVNGPHEVEGVGFAGAAALAIPAAKGVVRVVKAAKDAGVVDRLRESGGAIPLRQLRERLRARPGRVIKIRGPFSVAGCCAKCGGSR